MAGCAGIYPDPSHGELVIDGVLMHNTSWTVLNAWVLWQGPEQRGSDLVIPGVEGVWPRRRRANVTVHTLEMVISKERSATGIMGPADPQTAEANIRFLRAFVADPTNTGDGTRQATLTFPDGNGKEGPVHVLGLVLGAVYPRHVRATMDISIPRGYLANIIVP